MHLQLRGVKSEDLEHLFQFQCEPEANEMADFPARDRNAFFEHWYQNILSNPAIAAQAIIVDDVVIGSIVLWQSENQWLLGYWVGREYWGKGYATNALRLFLSAHSTRPIFAEVAQHNVGSIAVLNKNGFTPMGVVEEADCDKPLLAFVLKN
ncbi:GNAT family N-acetyltransferase [Shewanella sp. 10N.286.52.A9]|uniref:GNAT family N-acetyltransferase n=1 Tax=Shewanella sp. 10N.286.52.A9 TaxID=3229711 RepID=UPI00354B630C